MTPDATKRFHITHPDLGAQTVSAIDRYDAIVQAAKVWEVRWTKIAKDCTVTDLGADKRYPCRMCGVMISEPGYCPKCQSLRADIDARAARKKRQERRS